MPARARSVLVQMRATLLAAIAACAIVGLPALRALHAGAHAAPAVVAAPSAVVDAATDDDESTCALCRTLSAADQPLAPHDAVATAAAIDVAAVVVAIASASSAPSRVPVHADARAPPLG